MVLLLVRAETFVRNFDTMALSRDRDAEHSLRSISEGAPHPYSHLLYLVGRLDAIIST